LYHERTSVGAWIGILLAVGIAGGCVKTEEAQNQAPTPGGSPMNAPGPGATPSGAATPGAAAPAGETSQTPHPELAKKVADLEEAYAKDSSDATKKQLVEAAFTYGNTMMNDPDLPPRVKYRAALKQFRRTLELDPNHEGAKKNKEMIESIYRQMGRPVPE
jgi:hypothetical protein